MTTATTWLKEPVNALTHLLGVVAASGITAVLLALYGRAPLTTLGLTLFGASSVALFAASTLLHAVRAGPRGESVLRKLDHAAIYLLIAGTYSPIALIALQPEHAALGWGIFITVWCLATAGLVYKLSRFTAPRWVSTGLYLALGWLVMPVVVPIARSVGTVGLAWLIAGGLFYSVGAVIYASKRPDPVPGVFGYHEIWHLFVLAGWACHAVLVFVIAGA